MAALVGCSSPSTVGVLGNGQFKYLCGTSETDSACAGVSSETDLPAAIAVGAIFDVGYAPNSSNNSGSTVQGATGYEIVPASSKLAAATGTTLRALRAGYVALLAQHTGNANVDDFVHLRFEDIQSLSAQPSSLVLAPGETHTVDLAAVDALLAPLAGRLGCQWTVTSGAPNAIVTAIPPGASATVQGLADGPATVHATCDTASVDVTVTVSGAPLADGGTNG
jgi:hypothetical protein